MLDFATWALVDALTVRQAACLWVGAEPSESPVFPTGVLKDQITAVEQMLTAAIRSGILDADSSTNALASIGDHSKTVVTREALRAFAESKNQRPAFLFDTLLPQKVKHGDDVSDDDTAPNVIARSPGPLVPLSEDDLDAYLRLDTWTLTQALFILSGNRPPGIESSSESMSHFPEAYHLAVNSIKSGNLCREIAVAGERHFIESPTRWFSWAERKSLHVAEAVRAEMMRGESVVEKADAPAQGTRELATKSSLNEDRPRPAPDRRFSEATLREWYEQCVKDHAKNERPPSREDDWAAAHTKFGDGVPRDAVRALRRELAPAEWKKGGHPKTGGRKHGGK